MKLKKLRVYDKFLAGVRYDLHANRSTFLLGIKSFNQVFRERVYRSPKAKSLDVVNIARDGDEDDATSGWRTF